MSDAVGNPPDARDRSVSRACPVRRFSLPLPLTLAALLVLLLCTPAASQELALLDQSPSRLRIAFGSAGTPAPLRTKALLGIPPEAQVFLEVVHARGPRQVDLPDEDQRPAGGPAYLGSAGFVRDQRVVEVVFAPEPLDEAHGLSYDEVVVDVFFAGRAGQTTRPRRDRFGEEMYRNILLNYEQARAWRHSPSRRLSAKPLSLGPDETRLRISVRDRGIYRISGRDLEQAGVDLGAIGPDQLRLLYGGGKPLPLESIQPPLVLREEPLVLETGDDGHFDPDDYLLFFGEPTQGWEYQRETGQYRHTDNLYTDANVYFLTTREKPTPALRATRRSGAGVGEHTVPVATYRARVHMEEERRTVERFIHGPTAYDWYWKDLLGAAAFVLQASAGAAGPVDIRLALIGADTKKAWLFARWNGEELEEFQIQPRTFVERRLQAASGVREGANELVVFGDGGSPTRLDWCEIEYGRNLVADNNNLAFSAPPPGGRAEYRLEGFSSPPRLFEVSESLAEIRDFAYDDATGSVTFQDVRGQVPREYIVGAPSTWQRPLSIELDAPDDLLASTRGADYLVLYHSDFKWAADRLAEWRGQDDRFGEPLRTATVDVQSIYDEFSGGMLDPAALRNFVHHAFTHWDPAPFFVVLFGDGCYDLKNNSGISPGTWIPPYEDGDSAFEDWYVRVAGDDFMPDLAIGRLPVQTPEEASTVVDKIIGYDQHPDRSPWQTRVLVVADDIHNPSIPDLEDYRFLYDAERMARGVLPRDLDLVKLYAALFPLEGGIKPQATDAFVGHVNEGALLMLYLGYGSPAVLAHEHIFWAPRDLERLDNRGRLPLLYAATSSIGYFDSHLRCMAEVLLNLNDRGFIGTIASTRETHHGNNVQLANAFCQQMYQTGRNHLPVGQALLEAKQVALPELGGGSSARSAQSYILIGDPATRLARPRYRIDLSGPDAVRGSSTIRIEGRILGLDGDPAPGFNGQVRLQAHDAPTPDTLDDYPYEKPGTPLYRGLAEVASGLFTFTIRLPDEIANPGPAGRISAYAWSDSHPSAFGVLDSISVQNPVQVDPSSDTTGPQVTIRFDTAEPFASGDTISVPAVLAASIRDDSGVDINGHPILLCFGSDTLSVADYFVNLGGGYRIGRLEHALPTQDPGINDLELLVWDGLGNRTRVQAQFHVRPRDETTVSTCSVWSWPNSIVPIAVEVVAGLRTCGESRLP